MGSREDDDYWNTKYAEASCHEHGDTMDYDEDLEEWYCFECLENEVAYKYG